MTDKDSLCVKIGGHFQCRYVPEQHLWVKCLRKNGRKIDLDHQKDFKPGGDIETEKYAVSNFIYLEYRQFCLRPPKHLILFATADFESCITHCEWLKLYKNYLDGAIDLPKSDPTRELINAKIKIMKRFRIPAKIITFPIPFKRLKEFRRNLRKKIVKTLTGKVRMPT